MRCRPSLAVTSGLGLLLIAGLGAPVQSAWAAVVEGEDRHEAHDSADPPPETATAGNPETSTAGNPPPGSGPHDDDDRPKPRPTPKPKPEPSGRDYTDASPPAPEAKPGVKPENRSHPAAAPVGALQPAVPPPSAPLQPPGPPSAAIPAAAQFVAPLTPPPPGAPTPPATPPLTIPLTPADPAPAPQAAGLDLSGLLRLLGPITLLPLVGLVGAAFRTRRRTPRATTPRATATPAQAPKPALPETITLPEVTAPEPPDPSPDLSQARALLVEAARRAPAWSVIVAATTIVGAGTSLLLPDILQRAVDVAATGRTPGIAFMLLAAVLSVDLMAELIGGLAGASYSAATTAWLRHRLLRHALDLGVAGQRRFGPGDLLSRVTGDAPASGQVLPALFGAVVAMLTSIAAIGLLWLIDWRLALTLALGVPPTLIALRVFMSRATDLFTAYREVHTAIAARLVDALAGIRTIRASGTVHRETRRVLAPLPDLGRAGRGMWQAQRQLTWQVALFVPLLEVGVLAVAGVGVAAHRISAGELAAAVLYVRLALSVFEHIDALVATVAARVGAGRIGEVLAQRPAHRSADHPADHPADRELPDGAGSVELRGVTVTIAEHTVLDDVRLHIPGGASVALVGRSGAGKTTLASLIGRIVEPARGTVLIDDVPVGELTRASIGRAVAYAFECPALLGSTVGDVISFARPTTSLAEIERAAVAAKAADFIDRLPRGYDTPLGDVALSGGEAQRLGLARAIAQDSRVLVLDDATSSLDTATEVQVQAALGDLLRDRTSIVVAHRAATAARADLVAWLEGGRLREVAPHEVLWAESDYRAVFGA